jgi:hypothetical protein
LRNPIKTLTASLGPSPMMAVVARNCYRIGREGRDEYGEPHAGKVFCNIQSKAGPLDAVEGLLNLHPYERRSDEPVLRRRSDPGFQLSLLPERRS